MREIEQAIARVRHRWLVRVIASAIALGGSVFAPAFLIALAFAGQSRSSSLAIGLTAALVAALAVAMARPRPSAVEAAQAIEAVHSDLDNLVVTAVELDAHPRPVRAEIRDAIIAQASARISPIDPRAIVPLTHPVTVAAMVMIGCAMLARVGADTHPLALQPPLLAVLTGEAQSSFDVRIAPPAYTKRRIEVLRDPVQVSVIAGSRIQIPAASRDWIATESTAIELRVAADAEPRFLSVIVVPDQPPDVRIAAPGKDAAYAQPKGQIDIRIHSSDDLALAALSLRFTRASGGGENVAFTEGELPLRFEKPSAQQWNAQASLTLESLGLADGDILVYRAIARDSNPNGSPVQSEQYLIEVGRNAEIADAGFALPSEEKKYAISQQMVIFKTGRLIAERASHPADWLAQARSIAIEQRMVRAEVVFLGGGEVEDELEEAAKSDELTEGRLRNTGRAEMLQAINAMSRAEAQLNDGRAAEALVFEKQALASLERALDRRRYFLRTLPDRSRIDASRRLTGERRDARSWQRDPRITPSPASLDGQRQLMRELAAGIGTDAGLAARIAAVDPSSSELQQAAVALASAKDDTSRRAARVQAMAAITSHALRALPATLPIEWRHDALAGQLAAELPARKRQ